MSLSPLTKGAPDPIAVCRHKFESVFDMHGVKTGSPEDLAGFVEKLRTDRYFAMDFWDIAKSAGKFGHGQVSRAEIREAVVQCVGGPGVQDTDPQLQEIQKEFNGKLSDEVRAAEPPQSADALKVPVDDEGDNPIDSVYVSPKPDVSSDPDVSSNPHKDSDPDRQLHEITPEADLPAYTIGSEGGAADRPDDAFSYDRSRQMDEALARLEINSNALKLQLDNIDSRMSRIEPHIEDLSSRVAISTGRDSTGEEIREPGAYETSAETVWAAESAAFGGAAPGKGPAHERRTAERRSMWPDGRSGMLAVVPVLLVMLLVVLMAWLWALEHRSHNQVANRGASVPENVLPNAAVIPQNPAADKVAPNQVAAPAAAPGSVPRKAEISSAAKENVRRTRTASDVSAERPIERLSRTDRTRHVTSTKAAEEEPAIESHRGLAPAPSNIDAREERSSVRDTDIGSRTLERRSGRTADDVKGRSRGISVSSGVMAANLIESHPPKYPRLARLAHMQGPVVLQVFISKDGTVDHVNAVKGHHLLRGAAKNAVKQWRYRPYLVKGVPVEVATIVTVDFSLDQ